MATTARTLITMPATAKRGDIIDIRVLVQHAMETGYRRDSDGSILKRDLIRRFEVQFVADGGVGNAANKTSGELVFAADLHAAISANPYLAFSYRARETGTLNFRWSGDNGFMHAESRKIVVSA